MAWLLHQPGDSGNVGTILRTALGFGIEDVALIRPCVDVFDPKTVRASMGSLFRLRVRVYPDFETYREEMGERDYYPFMLDASIPLTEALEQPVRSRRTLIFGNEGHGLPPFFASVGQPVRIPSNEKVDSLNLAIAAGIGIYASFVFGFDSDTEDTFKATLAFCENRCYTISNTTPTNTKGDLRHEL